MEKSRKGKENNTVLVLDFGAQYAQLITNSVRKNKAYSLVQPYDISIEKIEEIDPVGIILSGGPESVRIENAPMPDPKIFKLGIPIMGICYGHQVMAKMLGGAVTKSSREYGRCEVYMEDRDTTPLQNSTYRDTVWMSHEDQVSLLPDGFHVIALSDKCKVAAMMDPERNFVSFQFHPEVEHTNCGQDMIEYFIKEMCKASCDWTMPDFVEQSIKSIREKIGNDHVIGAISGGVDSVTASLLMNRAVGDRYTGIFVNNGLMRKGEPEQVNATLTSLDINFRHVDASERFLSALKGVADPDQKRKIIGHEFIKVFEEEAAKLSAEKGVAINYLVQGTLYPDVIESTSAHGGPTAKIKRHHNVGGLPEAMKLKLIEPFRELFKDEVRLIGASLGLPKEVVKRHPFPGPGNAIRCIGPVTKERLAIQCEGDAIWIEELHKEGFYYKIGQAFLVLEETKAVGVQGDSGTYKWVASLRSVDTSVYMTASRTRFPDDFLDHVVNRIINEVEGIGRVTLDLTSKPPGTIEWE